jgi:hypothetical protein
MISDADSASSNAKARAFQHDSSNVDMALTQNANDKA